jgi:hypothetical protein
MASYYGPWNRAKARRAKQLCEAADLDTAVLPNEMQQELRQIAEP